MNQYSLELMHYGVQGMHWGIRRYQPYPKSYTGIGKEIAEAKIKRHNAIKEATLASMNRTSAAKKVAKYEVKLTKDATGNTQKKLDRARKDYEFWDKQYKLSEKKANSMVKKYQNRYGTDKIGDVPYKNGIVKGDVYTKPEKYLRIAGTAAAIATISPLTATMLMPSTKVTAAIHKVKVQRNKGVKPADKFEATLEKGLDLVDGLKVKLANTLMKDIKLKRISQT